MRVQVLGLCRFSYLGGRGFQVEHEDLDARRDFLYDHDRLERRWFWFENVTLPAFLAQTDPDFTLVLMTGPDLPEPWLGRLRQLERDVRQIRLSLVRPMHYHLQACKHALLPHIEKNAKVVAHFRQDDDDAVAVDYVQHAREDFRLLRPLYRQNKKASIDYMKGLVLKTQGTRVEVEPRMIYNAVAALTVYLPPKSEYSATHFPHWRLAHHMPGMILGEKPMFCRLLNHDNDSGAIGPGYTWESDDIDVGTVLWERFHVDLAKLREGAARFDLPPAPRPHWGAT